MGLITSILLNCNFGVTESNQFGAFIDLMVENTQAHAKLQDQEERNNANIGKLTQEVKTMNESVNAIL